MPLFSTVTTTAQYMQDIVNFTDLATIVSDLEKERYNYCDMCIQNNGSTDVRLEYGKDATVGQCYKIDVGGYIVLRIVFNETDLFFRRISLVSEVDNDNVTYIVLPAYPEV